MGGSESSFTSASPRRLKSSSVIRLNRDTLYSAAVFDLDVGPVTITLPDSGARFLSMQVIDEDQYAPSVFYGEGKHTLTKDSVGTRYVITAVRILVDPDEPAGRRAGTSCRTQSRSSSGSTARLTSPIGTVSQKKVRDALLVLGSTLPDSRDVRPEVRCRSCATFDRQLPWAWGGNPEKDAMYLNITPERNDGTTVHHSPSKTCRSMGSGRSASTTQRASSSENHRDAYTINDLTATKEATAPSPFNLAVATPPPPTACRSRRAGTTWSGCTAREGNSSKGPGNFPKHRPCAWTVQSGRVRQSETDTEKEHDLNGLEAGKRGRFDIGSFGG